MHARSDSCLTLCSPMDCSPPGSPSMGFSRQQFWSGLPCPPLGDQTQGSNPRLLHLLHWQVGSLPPGKPIQSVPNFILFYIKWLRDVITGCNHEAWRRKWQPTPVSLSENLTDSWSLVGCSPWGRKESAMTEQLTHYIKWLQDVITGSILSITIITTTTYLMLIMCPALG